MSKNYSQPGTAVNQATYIVTLDGLSLIHI